MENSRFRFRVWDRANNKMVYFDFSDLIVSGGNREGGRTHPLHSYSYTSLDKSMECTGLKDKNGNLIYEGDIVEVEEDDEDSAFGNTFKYIAAISFGNSLGLSKYNAQYPQSFCLICKKFYKEQCLITDLHRSYIEIIGNIHENKELLEV